jgi:hypothetical protein
VAGAVVDPDLLAELAKTVEEEKGLNRRRNPTR